MGRESLEDDSRSGRGVNVKWHNLAESLIDACMGHYQKMKKSRKAKIRKKNIQFFSNVFINNNVER